MQSPSLILASASPRRAFLLRECGFTFEIRPTHVSEEFDKEMDLSQVPAFLASKKAEAALHHLKDHETVLAADTVVIFENKILNKPANEREAFAMLKKLSGNTHKVITAVVLANKMSFGLMEETSWVTFLNLNDSDVHEYIKNYRPMDKAGAYGAQECLPENYNPCSGHERNFLQRIGKPDLFANSKSDAIAPPMIAIQEIAGSYFNVMGLPIAHLYDKLKLIL